MCRQVWLQTRLQCEMLVGLDIRAVLAQVLAAMKAVDRSDILTADPDFVAEGERLRREHEVRVALPIPR